MGELKSLTPEALARAEEKLRHPLPGSRIESAKNFGVDLTLLIEQLRISPADRARRMHEAAQVAERARGSARRLKE